MIHVFETVMYSISLVHKRLTNGHFSRTFSKKKINKYTELLFFFCNAAAQRVILFMFKFSFTLVSNMKTQYLETYFISVYMRTGVTRCRTEDKSVHLVNKVNLVQNLFFVYFSISTRFGRLCAHHLEKQMCLCDT